MGNNFNNRAGNRTSSDRDIGGNVATNATSSAAASENKIQTKPLQRPRMSVEQRAKQFMPFAAVTGLEKALREKEKEIEERGVYERV